MFSFEIGVSGRHTPHPTSNHRDIRRNLNRKAYPGDLKLHIKLCGCVRRQNGRV
jgi:hypothetical protein